MLVIRAKIQSLEFIPDAELRVQYTDDENTLTPTIPSSMLGVALQMYQGRQ